MKTMHEQLRGIADYLAREALHGWYDKRDIVPQEYPMLVMRAYHVLTSCIRAGTTKENKIAEEVTKAVLMVLWGRALSTIDMRGERLRRAIHDVERALKDSINKTNKMIETDAQI